MVDDLTVPETTGSEEEPFAELPEPLLLFEPLLFPEPVETSEAFGSLAEPEGFGVAEPLIELFGVVEPEVDSFGISDPEVDAFGGTGLSTFFLRSAPSCRYRSWTCNWLEWE